MTLESSIPQNQVSTKVKIQSKNFSLTFQATVQTGLTTAKELLPLACALSDTIVSEACRSIELAGERISCSPGCGACCRNLVAISQIEARHISDTVAAFPESRRSFIQQRFQYAQQQLSDAGYLEKLRDFDSWTGDDYKSMVGLYFSLAIPCPFLEDESCSIYEDRPITCREFLVTSPPEFCAKLGSVGVRQVILPIRLFNAVARWQVPPKGEFLERWVPLILALDWVESNLDCQTTKTGVDQLQDLLACIEA
jgi:Fe-S-cluster containining protein